jgi:hypothetical protein
LGGGVVATAGYALVKEKLIKDFLPIFAKRSELDAVGGKVTGVISMATMARERADSNADAIIRLQEGEKHRWEPVLKALDRINGRLDAGEKRDERHATMLDQLERRLDRGGNGNGRQ